MTRQLFFFGLIAAFGTLASFLPVDHPSLTFHSEQELALFSKLASPDFLPDSASLFPHSNTCEGCHGFDVNEYASITAAGEDVNVYDDWSATMMANSAKDPFWRAKVSHEVLVNPAHSSDLQTKCTSCHAPQGHFTAILRGAAHYHIEDMLADTTAMDGVSCGACHMQSESLLGDLHSGDMRFDTMGVLYGPYDIPFAAPMIQYVGFEPVYSEHINDAGICAGCHTLLTNSVDLEGNYTGETFVEQATYHEWLNSSYETDEVTCQGCHMPRLEEPIVISSNYLFLEGREPYGLHDLVGANTAMLKLMKEHRDTLGITATEAAFDETIEKTLRMLQEQSVDALLAFEDSANDTAYFSLELINKAGHKFPSGYPSRRAFVEFWVVAEGGDTLFHSGRVDADWEIEGLDEPFEPHYTYIDQPGKVQVYETVIADVSGAFTTVLERAAITLKDNRLPPLGFTTSDPVYDTTLIVGAAEADPDFNWKDGAEGSGADRLFYHVPLGGYTGNINAGMRVHYQSLPPRWMAPMLAESTPEIDLFRDMFQSADLSTVIVAEELLESVFVTGVNATTSQRLPRHLIRAYPNPAGPEGLLYLRAEAGLDIQAVRLYDATGRLVWESGPSFSAIPLPAAGLYLLEATTTKGIWTEKVVRN